ncbi:MAG: hypothetical protein ABIH04_00390, partial [Planctomycetota bacterium]
NAGEKIFNALNKIGTQMLRQARELHGEGKLEEAIEMLKDIRDKQIYKDGDGIEGNVRRELANWEEELP